MLAAPAAHAAPRLTGLGQFSAPLAAAAPADDGRLFVVERSGTIRVLGADGALRPEPFLDVSSEVLTDGERGLLGLAFAPDFASSRAFFVFMAVKRGAAGAAASGEIQIRRYTVDPADPNRADPASMTVLLRQPHADFANHDGGTVRIGPDGKLWAGIGDGGDGNDTVQVDGQPSAQSLKTLLGKIVRINLDGSIPDDNPYPGSAIWASGLRNPYRFSFDGQTGDLVVGDVGQGAREEIDVARAADGRGKGANYGWPCLEGTRVNTEAKPAPCTVDGAVPPAYEYDHATDGGVAITGGVVVRDPGLPTLAGRYLFADLGFGSPQSLLLRGSGAIDRRAEDGIAGQGVVSFDEDGCGRVVLSNIVSGTVARVQDGAATACPPPSAIATPAPTPGTTDPGSTPPVPDAATPTCRATVRVRDTVRLRRVRRRGVAVTVSVLAGCRVTLRLRGGDGSRTVTLLPGATRRLHLRPGRAQRRALARRVRRDGVARGVLVVQLQPGAGAARKRRAVVAIVG